MWLFVVMTLPVPFFVRFAGAIEALKEFAVIVGMVKYRFAFGFLFEFASSAGMLSGVVSFHIQTSAKGSPHSPHSSCFSVWVDVMPMRMAAVSRHSRQDMCSPSQRPFLSISPPSKCLGTLRVNSR